MHLLLIFFAILGVLHIDIGKPCHQQNDLLVDHTAKKVLYAYLDKIKKKRKNCMVQQIYSS